MNNKSRIQEQIDRGMEILHSLNNLEAIPNYKPDLPIFKDKRAYNEYEISSLEDKVRNWQSETETVLELIGIDKMGFKISIDRISYILDKRKGLICDLNWGLSFLGGVIRSKIDNNSKKISTEKIFATGCISDAWNYVSNLVREAKQRIVLIDKYVDDSVLSLIEKRAEGVDSTIYTRYDKIFKTDIEKHNKQYRQIKYVQLSQKIHDRFLIIDGVGYLLGASLKDMGNGLCTIIQLNTLPEEILELLNGTHAHIENKI